MDAGLGQRWGHTCLHVEEEVVIDNFSSDFEYRRACDSTRIELVENFCANCGQEVEIRRIKYD